MFVGMKKHCISVRFVQRMLALGLSLIAASAVQGANQLLPDAARDKDAAQVRSLLAAHTDPNSAQADGTTALSWAAHWNDEELSKLLIAEGADPNRANDFGYTPLWQACNNGNAPLVELLLKAKASPNVKLWTGETALMTCSRTGTLNGVKALLARGADVNAKENERGQTALMWAAARKYPLVVKALIDGKANVRERSKVMENYTPMKSRAYNQNHYLPKYKGGFTPLMFAAQAGDLESVKLLLAAGADVNDATPDDGNTLVLASQNAQEDVALYLLEKGANPNSADGFGITPLHWSMQRSIELLYGRPKETDKFWTLRNMPELAKALLVHGANPNARIKKEFLPYDIHRFARSRFNDLPQVHLTGASAFLLAAASGEVAVMRMLLEAKADGLIATEEGFTPLMAAAGTGREKDKMTEQDQQNYLEAAKLAIQLGADVNAIGPDGRTALHGAAALGETEVIKLLAKNGVNFEAKDKYGETALSIALGDPGQFVYRQLPGGEYDYSFRQPKQQKKIGDLLLQLGASPYSGPVADRSGQ